MCDRILILASNPGHIAAEIVVPLPHPRDRLATAFRDVVDDIYSRMTAGPAPAVGNKHSEPMASISTRLPILSAMRIVGLAEVLSDPPFSGRADLPVLAAHLDLGTNDLFRVAEIAQMMGFAELRSGDLHLTAAGRALAEADIPGRKRLFGDHLLRSVPLAAHIRRILDERPSHMASRDRFLTELEDHLSTEDAEHTLSAVIGWGRYAECFAYDHMHRMFSLENPR